MQASIKNSEWNLLSYARLFVTHLQLDSPWNFPGQNTGVGSLSNLQGNFPTRDRTQVSHTADRFFTSWATREAQRTQRTFPNNFNVKKIPFPFGIEGKTFFSSVVEEGFFFPFIFISWRLITLQYCSGFCHTLTWISHGFTCIPHPDPPSHLLLYLLPLGLPSTPAPSTCLMHLAWTGNLFHHR